MKRSIFILVLLFPLLSFGQIKLDTANIKNEPFIDSFFAKIYGLPPIGSSPNKVEIRINVVYEPIGQFEARVLSFDGHAWHATSVESSPTGLADTAGPQWKTTISYLSPKLSFDSIISKLNKIGIFALPDQTELPGQWFVDDGALYSVAFKVGDKLRMFSFNNPKDYKDHYPKTTEYALYCDLVDLFFVQLGK